MKKLAPLILLPFFFAGCISLKIKSELPKTQSYDLNPVISSDSCKEYKSIGLISIDSTGIYDNKKIIVRSDDGKISSKDGIQWVDSPKNIFKDLLIAEGVKHCILISLPPFGTELPQNILKLTLLSLEIRDTQIPQAQMSLSYNLIKSGKKINGFLKETQKIEGDDVKALQEVAKKIVDGLVGLFEEQ